MVAAVEAARAAGIPTGLISNSWGTGIYDRAPMQIFDATVISGDVGLHKPQPEIYLLGAERIGVPPERCVFVDDLRENVEGAEAVGMAGVLHRESRGDDRRARAAARNRPGLTLDQLVLDHRVQARLAPAARDPLDPHADLAAGDLEGPRPGCGSAGG